MNPEKWKSMTWRERTSWVFEYYGAKIVACIVGVLVIGYLVFSMFGGNEDPCGLRVLILDDRISYEKTEALTENLEKQFSVPVEVVGYTSAVTEEMQAFTVRLTAGGIDVVIAPENEMKQLEENGYFKDGCDALPEGCRYDAAVYEAAAENGKQYIGAAASSENPENAAAAVKYLTGDAESRQQQ